MSCPIESNSNTNEFTVHTSCYCVLGLLCVNQFNLLMGHQKTMGLEN